MALVNVNHDSTFEEVSGELPLIGRDVGFSVRRDRVTGRRGGRR